MFGRQKRSRHNVRRYAFLAGGAALLAYLFDPRMGRTRRAKLSDQVGGAFRRTKREVERKTEYTKGQLEGMRHVGSSGEPPPSDQALVAKVESEVLSRWQYPKGSINVNAVDGVVELRGTCESPDQISDLEHRVRGVTGVADVHNYLHLPHTPAPNKQEALRASH